MERLIVDRTEEGIAVLEKADMSYISLPLTAFDFTLKEGDILLFDGENYIRDENEADKRRQKLLLMQKKLKEKSENK